MAKQIQDLEKVGAKATLGNVLGHMELNKNG
jgi:hypothetical protein